MLVREKIKKAREGRFLFDFLRMFLFTEKPCGGGMLFATAGTRMAMCKTVVAVEFRPFSLYYT